MVNFCFKELGNKIMLQEFKKEQKKPVVHLSRENESKTSRRKWSLLKFLKLLFKNN